ncbi:MAG: hypothetical protein EOP56_00380 [Sphingobacteriales bacterium]|nr:MAG: hypothetical protein EOP56_00380 [Sphingobacteriales bacterium]
MKTSIVKFVNRLTLMIMSLFVSVYSFAQEEGKSLNIDVTRTESTTTTNWYANPWVWIVGAAIFILLFAAIIRGNRSDA